MVSEPQVITIIVFSTRDNTINTPDMNTSIELFHMEYNKIYKKTYPFLTGMFPETEL